MTDPSPDDSSVNTQITDSVTQARHTTGSHAPTDSIALTDVVMAETISMGMHNAINAQHSAQMTGAAAVTAACARIINGNQQPVIQVNPPDPDKPVSPLTPVDPATIIAQAQAEAQKAIEALNASAKEATKNVDKAKQALEQLTKDVDSTTTDSGKTDDSGGGGSGSDTKPDDTKG